MTSPQPLASLQSPKLNDLNWDPGDLIRSDFVEATDRESFPSVLSEERVELSRERRQNTVESPETSSDSKHEPNEQLNGAAHNTSLEQREAKVDQGEGSQRREPSERGEEQALQAQDAETHGTTADADEARSETVSEESDANKKSATEKMDKLIAQEFQATQDLLQPERIEANEVPEIDASAKESGTGMALSQIQQTESGQELEQVRNTNKNAHQSNGSRGSDSRTDSAAERIVDYLVENSSEKSSDKKLNTIINKSDTTAPQQAALSERAVADNLNTTRELLQNLKPSQNADKNASKRSDNANTHTSNASVNTANTTPSENRLTLANAPSATNAVVAAGTSKGSSGKGGEQKWDGLPGQTAWQGTITGASKNGAKQLPIANQARNLMMQAAQTLPAHKGVEGRRLSLTLPMDKMGPVRMILSPTSGDSHQMTFIVNSASAAAALRRILPELEETASTFPVEVVDISIVTEENQATAQEFSRSGISEPKSDQPSREL